MRWERCWGELEIFRGGVEEDIPIRLWDDIRLRDDSLASQFFCYYFLLTIFYQLCCISISKV